MRTIFKTAAILLAPLFINAQSLSLKECVDLGIKNHPDYHAGVLNA